MRDRGGRPRGSCGAWLFPGDAMNSDWREGSPSRSSARRGLLIGGGVCRDAGCRRSAIAYDQGDLWAAFAPTLDLYQPSSFERTQRPPLRVGLDIPFLQHKIGDYEGVGLAQPLDVPEC